MARPFKLRRRVKISKLDVPEDIVAVERALEKVGYYEPPVFGTGRSAPWELDNAIRQLQTDRGLKSDGVIEPDGPTAEHINALLTGRRRRPDNPSADTQIAEARRKRAAARARGAAPPDAGRPPRPVPSFLERHTPTLLDGATRELSGGAEAAEPRLLLPDDPGTRALLAELRREKAAERAGFGDTPPPEAQHPPRPTPSFLKSNTPTLLGNAMRELAGGSAPTLRDRASLAPAARPKQGDPNTLADSAEDFLNLAADVSEGVGLVEAPKNLRRFLAQDEMPEGDDIVPMPRDEALRLETIREAVAVNEDRVRRSFTDVKLGKGIYATALLKLKDGETRNLGVDEWDRDVGFGETVLNALADLAGLSLAGTDFMFAFGRVKLNTRQNFTATRRGDTIFLKGTVTHLWDERYDFDSSTDSPDSGLLSAAAIVAEKGGRAREFTIISTWDQDVEGTVTIKNGTLSNLQLRWSDGTPP